MISKFKIENFRLFDSLQFEQLRRVNLIVGKNSSGKSAILEALLIFCKQANPRVIDEILSVRKEDIDLLYSTIDTPWRNLFRDRHLPAFDEDGFKLASEQSEMHITTAAFYPFDTADGFRSRFVAPDELANFDTESLENHLVAVVDGHVRKLLSVDRSHDVRGGVVQRRGKSFQYISTQGIKDEEAALLWDAIGLTEYEAHVIEAVKLIEPSITGIAFVQNGRKRIPVVKLAKVAEPVPLQSLGDGTVKVFHIILALVCMKGETLIIDEFENGLHWSIQDQVWAIIFALAETLDVQVFATTHSKDCIQSFFRNWQANENSGGFTRVVKTPEGTSITEYDVDLLADSVEMDVEVR